MKTKFAVCAVTMAVLSACGGGGQNSGAVATPPVQTVNSAPLAQAGAAQNIVAGTAVTLDGGASSDKEGDALSYAWVLTSKPAGSAAVLSSATAVKPTFTADVAGAYVATLIVNDGKINSAASTVTVTASILNAAPVANPGIAQNIVAGTTATLDGSASSDANGDTLTYAWVLSSKPNGSAAVLAAATTAKPTFTADVAGEYIATLVVNDGKVNSVPLTVAITATVANAAPVATAGNAQSVIANNVVTLDGSASLDANGDALTYVWVLTSKPAGSNAVLKNATSAKPTFIADITGLYIASLVVNDGKASSATANVQITVSAVNAAPVANAGIAQNAVTGTTIRLDGSGSSDANGDPLTYSWGLTSKPAGSSLTFSSVVAQPNFTADVPGTYVFTLTTNDGKVNSTPASVTVTASAANVAPVANAGTAQSVTTGATVTLNGNASSDANGDPLTYAWAWVSKPAGSAATILPANAVQPTFVADVEGTYVASLTVKDGKVNSAAVNVAVTAITNALMLYRQTTDFFNGVTETQVNLPYANTGSMQSACTGSCPTNVTIDTFKLTAVGSNFTIKNLSATDSTGRVVPTFGGLSQSQVISAGNSVIFTLLSPKTSNAVAKLTYQFTVVETGTVFSYSVDFKSN